MYDMKVLNSFNEVTSIHDETSTPDRYRIKLRISLLSRLSDRHIPNRSILGSATRM